MSLTGALAIGGSLLGGLFGSNQAKKAAQQQSNDLREAQRLQREATDQARADINRLFPVAQQNLLTGAQGAMDVFNQITPQQMQVMQQGNMAAQQALLAGLPQMNNAILGMPVDYSGFTAQQFATPQFNFSMPNFNQNYGPPANAQQQTQQQAMQTPQGQQQFVQNVLAGMFGGQGATSIMGGGGGAGNRNAGDRNSLFMR